MNEKNIMRLIVFVFCLLLNSILAVGVFYTASPNFIHHVTAQACTADFTKADCSWDAVPGATSYSIKVSLINKDGTSSVIKQDSVTGATQYTFAVQQNNTYECDVSAVNSCGTGPAGQITALCSQSAAIVTSTIAPKSSASATLVPPTNTSAPAKPVLAATGNNVPTLIIGIGGMAITIIGGLLLLL